MCFFRSGTSRSTAICGGEILEGTLKYQTLRENIEKCHKKSWSARDAKAQSMSIPVVARSCWLTFDGTLVSQVEQSSIFAEAEFNEQRHRFLCLSCWCSDHLFLRADPYRTPPRACPWFDCRWDSHQIRWFPHLQGSDASGRLCKAGKQSRVESLFPNSQSEVEVSGYRKDWKGPRKGVSTRSIGLDRIAFSLF